MSDLSSPASRMRHCLLQPSAAIKILLKSSTDQNADPERLLQIRDIALKAVEDLEIDLKDITKFLLLEYNKINAELGHISLHDAIIEAITEDPLTAPSLERVQISDPLGLAIRSDARLLNYVLNALIKNALEFSSATVSVDVRDDGPHAIVTIVDKGIGIEDDILEKLGTPFIVKNASKTSRATRMGVGLATAVRSLQYLKGHLDLRRNGEDGTIATLALPTHR